MKTCPYCANSVQDAAIKCQYCHENLSIDRSDALPAASLAAPTGGASRRTRNQWHPLQIVLLVAGLVAFAAIAGYRLYQGRTLSAAETGASAVVFLVIAPLLWFLGDIFRRFAMPDFYFASGAVDLARKRLFWMVGPQSIAVLVLAGLLVYVDAAFDRGQAAAGPRAASSAPAPTTAATMPGAAEPQPANDAAATSAISAANDPLPPGLPATDSDYYPARQKLIAAGLTPVPGNGQASHYCLDELTNAAAVDDCKPDVTLPEVQSCTGTGLNSCITLWSYRGRFIIVQTQGEPSPGGIVSIHWASADEMAELREQAQP